MIIHVPHRSSGFLRKHLSGAEMKSVAGKIAEVEGRTSGEIRVCILQKRGWPERKLSPRELAIKEFHRLGMHKTKDRTGVLILLLLGEHKFEIIGDSGIHTRIPDGTWDQIAEAMSGHFKEGRFADGLTDAVTRVGDELARHFPRRPDDVNELPNDLAVG